MKSNSMGRLMLVAVLSISLIATGCSAQWVSVALADLPVLTQMALNIAALVATLQSGRQLNPAEALAIQNISSEASKEPGVAGTPASASHQRPCAFRSNDGGGQPDPHQREQFRFPDSSGCVAEGGSTEHHDPSAQGPETAVESAGVRSPR